MSDEKNKVKWKDSRMHSPPCNGARMYPVLFKLIDGIATDGFALWMPNDGYKTGKWDKIFHTTTNTAGNAEVLYWCDLPEKPKDVDL